MTQGILSGGADLKRKSQGFCASRGTHRSMEGFAARDGVTATILSQIHASIVGGRSMTFTIHAWKADQSITTVRIGPAVAVDKARELEKMGWQVYVTNAAGSRFAPANFDRLLSITHETA